MPIVTSRLIVKVSQQVGHVHDLSEEVLMHLHLFRLLIADAMLDLDVLDAESLMDEACLVLLAVTVDLGQLVKLNSHRLRGAHLILEPQPRLVWFGAT